MTLTFWSSSPNEFSENFSCKIFLIASLWLHSGSTPWAGIHHTGDALSFSVYNIKIFFCQLVAPLDVNLDHLVVWVTSALSFLKLVTCSLVSLTNLILASPIVFFSKEPTSGFVTLSIIHIFLLHSFLLPLLLPSTFLKSLLLFFSYLLLINYQLFSLTQKHLKVVLLLHHIRVCDQYFCYHFLPTTDTTQIFNFVNWINTFWHIYIRENDFISKKMYKVKYKYTE